MVGSGTASTTLVIKGLRPMFFVAVLRRLKIKRCTEIQIELDWPPLNNWTPLRLPLAATNVVERRGCSRPC